jgi:ubiquinone/menaquinone biosynthesis C-methylase UbiE
MDEKILQYYAEDDESSRITGDAIERIRTQEIISRYVSSSPLNILDIGGAAGVYSFWLSELGHKVSLLDITEKHVEQAKDISKKSVYPLESIHIGDGRRLPFGDESFDVVLLLGPLYHLTEQEERIKTLLEARRVMKKGAIIFTAAISRYASMIDGFVYNLINDPVYVEIMMEDLNSGHHRNIGDSKYFTTSFFHLPEELVQEMTAAEYSEIEIFSVEGVSEIMPDLDKRMKDPDFRSILFNVLKTTEKDSAFMGMSAHFLGKGYKK